jgi:dipeptidyl-peptidase 4
MDFVERFPGRLTPVGEDGPTAIAFVPGRNAILSLQPESDGGPLSLWYEDLATGDRRRLLEGTEAVYSLSAQRRRERGRIVRDGVAAFEVRSGASGVEIVAHMGATVYRGGLDDAFVPWPGVGEVDAAALCPEGAGLIYSQSGDLWLARPDGAKRRVTDSAADGIVNGLADYAAAEELGRQEGMWLSPDGRSLAYAEVDDRHVPEVQIVHQSAPVPVIERLRYPFVGGPIAHVRLGVVGLPQDNGSMGQTRWIDSLGDDAYLLLVRWTRDGRLAALVCSRDQHHMEWRIFQPNGEPPLVFGQEESDHWLAVPTGAVFLDTGALLTTRERDGHAHLAMCRLDGGVRFLTQGDWDVTAILDVDEEADMVALCRTDRRGLDRVVARLPLSGGEPQQLSPLGATATALFSPDHGSFILQVSSPTHATKTQLCARDGQVIRTLYEDPAATADALGFVVPELVGVPATDGTILNGAVFRPLHFGSGAVSAAVVSVYGGPHQTVADTWTLTADVRAQTLVAAGFVVFKLDNRGTDGRGVGFAHHVEHAIATVEIEDQITGVRWLVEQVGVDPNRIGIYGWSYGAFVTLHALMRAPDVFQCGVAGAPATDWSRYDTAYTERVLGTPDAYPGAFARANVLPYVDGLRGDLLILHGLVDENVHFGHTARLIQALIEAGKRFEVAVLPTSRHMPRDGATRHHVDRRYVDWFLQHLGSAPSGSAAPPDRADGQPQMGK